MPPAPGSARTGAARALRTRWRSSRRAPTAEASAALRASIEVHHPGFWEAVQADASITARYRGEHADFTSWLDALVQVVRLACITDSFLAQCCYRAKVACRLRGIPVLPVVLHRLAVTRGQLSIGDHAVLEAGIYIPHGQVVIDGITWVRSGAVLRPFVTLGLRDGWIFGPTIEPGVKVGTGAKIFGPVTVGADAQVGANAVVNRDVPPGRTAVGAPARLLPVAPDVGGAEVAPEH